MKSVLVCAAVFGFAVLPFLFSPGVADAQRAMPVFPGAAGFGTTTPAGSGRHVSPPQTSVYKVTTLADSGAGSLRDCAKRAGARVCVFEISGTILLLSELLIDKPYITVAGQTAPEPGILLTGAGIRVAANDVLIQHLQIRPGDRKTGPKPESRDAVTIAGKSSTTAKRVVLDHLSVSWGIDENMGIWYPSTSDVTISNSIIAEGLYKSIHPKGPHSMGVLVGDEVKQVSMHHNLLAHNYDRNPRIKPGAQLEFVSNVVYGWGGSSSWNQANLSDSDNLGYPSQLFFVGNYYKQDPKSPGGSTVYAKPASKGTKVYVASNYGPTRKNDLTLDWLISSITESFRSLVPPFPVSGIFANHPIETYANVLLTAGSRPKESNSVDSRIISEVSTGKGTIKDCVAGCSRPAGGYPELKSVKRTLVLPANPNVDEDGDGYTNLEEYLHGMAAALE